MPLDENLFGAIAGVIAETETAFRAELNEEVAARQVLDIELHALLNARVETLAELRDRLVEVQAEAAERVTAAVDGLSGKLGVHALQLAAVDTKLSELDATLRQALDELDQRTQLNVERLVAAGLDRMREARLELEERLLSAKQQFDSLCDAVEARLAAVKDGEQGPPGEPGRDGIDGKDGADGKDGVDGKDGADGITGEARGLHDPAESYRQLDRVSLNGSEWVAKRDDPGPLPGDGWMLSAQGKKGRPGVSVQELVVDGYALLVELTNGKTVRCDLRSMFERYHQERDE